MELPNYFSVLPAEMIATIFNKCSVSTMLGIERTCKQFQGLALEALEKCFLNIPKNDFSTLKKKVARVEVEKLNLTLLNQKNQTKFKLILLVHLSASAYLWNSRIDPFNPNKQLIQLERFLEEKFNFAESFSQFSVTHPQLEKPLSIVYEEFKQKLQSKTQDWLNVMQIRSDVSLFDGARSFFEVTAADSASLFYRGLKCLKTSSGHARGVHLLNVANHLQFPPARAKLGAMYMRGDRIPKNIDRAVELLKSVCEAGNVTAQVNFGSMLLMGDEVECDQKQGLYWIEKAAEKGFAEAEYMMGFCYLHGIVVKQNIKLAIDWNRRAAKQKDLFAIAQLGFIYSSDLSGEFQDLHKGLKWSLKAAKKGFDALQVYVGCCYLTGRGTERNAKRAFFWTQKAALKGNLAGINNLAVMHEVGVGTEVNHEEALRLYQHSAFLGYPIAKWNLEQLTARLNVDR